MTDETTQALLPVTQADRDAAADLFGTSPWSREQFLSGKRDKTEKVQAFARHRPAHSRPSQADAGEGVRSLPGEVIAEAAEFATRQRPWGFSDVSDAQKLFSKIAALTPTSGEEMRLREALAGLVKWSDNIMRAHGVTGEQIAVTKARAALTKGAE